MKADELVKSIRHEFFNRLERKTGWRKNEVKVEFTSAVVDALAKTVTLSNHPELGIPKHMRMMEDD